VRLEGWREETARNGTLTDLLLASLAPRSLSFFTSSKPTLQISINDKIHQSTPTPFPAKISSPLSMLDIGTNFDGQMSPVYLLNSPISGDSVTSLMQGSSSSTSFSSAKPLDTNTDSKDTANCFAMVYDPSRTSPNANLALDVHSGVHLELKPNTQAWVLSKAKDVINSIGGIQTFLPLFRSLPPSGPVSAYQPLIPTLFFLLASFLRSSPANQAALYDCGGIQIIEASLLKARGDEHMLVCRYDKGKVERALYCRPT